MPNPTSPEQVQPEKILKDLGKLWVDLGKQESQGVLRACEMTLIAVLEEAEDPASIGETIASLMREHPSRAIVIRVRPGADKLLEARVLAQCWMPFGRQQQICCEQVEITASKESLSDVATVVQALAVPDLPVVLWCPDAILCQTPQFQDLLPLAGKLIVDSERAPDLGILRYLNGLPRTRWRVADLMWGKLTPWRETIARIFDKPENLRIAYSLENIQMLYTGVENTPAVHYLAGWFMHILGSGVHLNVARGVGPSYANIARVDLHGPGFEATVDLMENTAAEIRVGDMRQRIVFPAPSDCDALRKELSLSGRDPIFEDALGLANLTGGGA
jgi:glucose-6-phosphate dehydrogenase assembly protein OpcA